MAHFIPSNSPVLPNFTDVKFYPGYSYNTGTKTVYAHGKYVALGSDGRVYVQSAVDGCGWERI